MYEVNSRDHNVKARELKAEIWEGDHSLLQEIFLGVTNESKASVKRRYRELLGDQGVLKIKVKEVE